MAKKEESVVEIRPLDIKRVNIRIVGDTPLIVHRWSEKAKKEINEFDINDFKKKADDLKEEIEDAIEEAAEEAAV